MTQQGLAICSSSSRLFPSSSGSTICSQAPKDSSMLLSMLPSAVRGRLPRLPSLRRSVSVYSLKAPNGIKSQRGMPPNEDTTLVRSKSGIGGTEMDIMRTNLLIEDSEGDRDVMGKCQRRTMEPTEGKSGIRWKFAGQGLSLLSLSISESNILSRKPESCAASPPFARQLYIHAVTYLLRGLPTNLTTEEGLSIRSTLPPVVIAPLRVEISGDGQPSFPDSESRIGRGPTEMQPSVLHRTLAASIVRFFLLIQFLLPYLKVLLRAAYEYERSHRISEKVLASSIETIDGLGRIGMRGGGAIWSSGLVLGVGECLNWIVEGVSGGIQEGLGEGMARVGVRKEADAKQRNEI